jgi:hypothetical protein
MGKREPMKLDLAVHLPTAILAAILVFVILIYVKL